MAHQLAPLRILVVDDNHDAADLIADFLEIHGHQAKPVYGGKEALQVAPVFAPHVVLLDLGMPDVDGYAVAADLKRRPELSDTLVVALTAWGDAATRERAHSAGFDRHLVKPASFDAILDVLAAPRR